MGDLVFCGHIWPVLPLVPQVPWAPASLGQTLCLGMLLFLLTFFASVLKIALKLIIATSWVPWGVATSSPCP
jgi:hypothetical protein